MPETTRLVTAGELQKFPNDDCRYELVEGRVIRMSPVGYEHGRIVTQLCFLLHQHVQGRRLGVVLTEVGFELASNPDTVRAPDVAFIRQERIPSTAPRGFWNGAPDLAVEVLSPEERPADVRAKVEEYLSHGVLVVLVIDPDEKTITAFRPSTPPITLELEDVLHLDPVVPGFRCRVREVID